MPHNQQYIIPTPSVSRDGAFVDVALFQHLDSDVHVKQDLTVDDIRSTAREFAAKDHSRFHEFVFFILSHGGSNDVIFGVKRGTISVSELMCLSKSAEFPSSFSSSSGEGLNRTIV